MLGREGPTRTRHNDLSTTLDILTHVVHRKVTRIVDSYGVDIVINGLWLFGWKLKLFLVEGL